MALLYDVIDTSRRDLPSSSRGRTGSGRETGQPAKGRKIPAWSLYTIIAQMYYSNTLTGRPVNSEVLGTGVKPGMSGIDTREKILEAAEKLFAEVGYDAATTREIAEMSGVTKALIHYHFKSKEELLASILDRYFEHLWATMTESIEGDGSTLDRLKRLVDAYMDFLAENRNFARTVQRETSGGRNIERIWRQTVPMYKMGMELLHDVYPATVSGDLAAEQVMISCFGMVVTYSIYSSILELLTGRDPFSRGELEKRKKHLHRMLEMIDEALNEDEAGGKRSSSTAPGNR